MATKFLNDSCASTILNLSLEYSLLTFLQTILNDHRTFKKDMSDRENKGLRCLNMKFPEKLWLIVNDCETGAIGWGFNGETITLEYERFQEEYLDKNVGFFKTSNIASFVRQLNLYGFRKCNRFNEDKHEFKHPLFMKGRKDLLEYVKRKPGSLISFNASIRTPKSSKVKNNVVFSSTEAENIAPKNEEKNSRQETPRTTSKRLPLRYRQDSNLMNPLRQFWWNNIYPAPYSNNLYCDRSIVEQGWMPMDSPFFNSQTFIKREPGKPENNENCYIKNTMNENQPSDSKINNNMYFLVVPGYSSPQSHDIYANPGYYGGIIPFPGLPFRDFHSNVSNIGTFTRRMPTNFGSESQKDHQYAKGMSLNNETINNNICAEEIYNEQLKNFQMFHQKD
ncbi:HSF_DOMAIN domain-containing protein [Trichonephila inaurata madagascariensis]|uniref:HSF_DOMAIN domain-containing protein n=1 Tax=Trichonephila inaurata madagascariensis TaxID=2747483 RepID=A0A8X7BW81_9ARAC|nr:HSF_DOMAIN domain-containing protein [Trichonephila inaurata madagascariensis]